MRDVKAEINNAPHTTNLLIDTRYSLNGYLDAVGTMIVNRVKIVYPLLALVLLLTSAPSYSALQIGDPAPDFTLQQLGGKSISLSSLRGRPTVIFFFCSCTLCRAVAKEWAATISSHPSSLHSARTIVVFTGSTARAKAFLTRTATGHAKWLFLVDPVGNAASNDFDIDPCPCVYVLSGDQHIVYETDDAQSPEIQSVADTMIGHIKFVLAHISQLFTLIPAEPPHTHQAPSIHLQTDTADGSTVTTVQGFAETKYDNGTVDPAAASTISHTFTLRNTSSIPAVIHGLQPSCGCTTAYIDGSPTFPYTIQPGKMVQVTVSIDLTDILPGDFQKSVYVFGEQGTDAMAYLEMDGRIKPSR